MLVNNAPFRTIWLNDDGRTVTIIDQAKLPHRFELVELETLDQACYAISSMQVRGAPLIGATAAYGMALALAESADDEALSHAGKALIATRPTAVNLAWGVKRVTDVVSPLPVSERAQAAYDCATDICNEDVKVCESLGFHGANIIADLARLKGGKTVNVLTHCNAGWLATVDWGTALAPIYKAQQNGIDVHVWVDETRPRNQGAFLTAWELAEQNIPHTVITDNSGGHLMQHGLVDLCLVGTDRTAASGDVCNKIGTYLKALAAHDNDVPFYACVPSSSVDWEIDDGVAGIPIEQRSDDEVRRIAGISEDGSVTEIELFSKRSQARNDAFDVTPSRLMTGLITERGIANASRPGLQALFPELAIPKA